MFVKSRWRSERMGKEATLARWGTYGQPVLVFPTAGGDAEEIERWQMLKVLDPLVSAGKVKIYSCDSVGGQVWFSKEGTPAHRMWMQNQFHQYIKHEVVPAIHRDCGGEVPIWTTGASIGAFHAVAVTCRFPNLFSRFIEVDRYTDDYFVSSPLQFVPTLEGPHLERLKKNFVLFASGAGRAENMGETWDMANVLGKKGIPNRVDPWGADVHHDWMTWRVMLPKYLGEWLAETKTGRSTP